MQLNPYFQEEHQLLREQVRRFVEKEIVPNGDAWEQDGCVPRALLLKMGELGFLGLTHETAYGGSGLDKAFVQMAIVKRNRTAFVRANPNYLYAGKSLHLPSLNEIRAMLVRETKSTKNPESKRDNREEIFFFGS